MGVQVMKLTDIQIKNLKPSAKVQKVADGHGLYIHISPAGGKLWRMAYSFDGKQKTLSFGAYPAISLKAARAKRDEAKELLASGIDPGAHKKAVKLARRAENASSYEVVAREWFAKYSAGWSESNKLKIWARQENDIFPFLAGKPINQITPPGILAALRAIEARGAIDTAHRALQDCGRIFRYAIATGRAERDPAADLRGALPPTKGNNFASITDTKEVGALLRALDAYIGNIVVAYALRLCCLCDPESLDMLSGKNLTLRYLNGAYLPGA